MRLRRIIPHLPKTYRNNISANMGRRMTFGAATVRYESVPTRRASSTQLLEPHKLLLDLAHERSVDCAAASELRRSASRLHRCAGRLGPGQDGSHGCANTWLPPSEDLGPKLRCRVCQYTGEIRVESHLATICRCSSRASAVVRGVLGILRGVL